MSERADAPRCGLCVTWWLLRGSNQRLELSVLFFMQQFRKVYVGDQARQPDELYIRGKE